VRRQRCRRGTRNRRGKPKASSTRNSSTARDGEDCRTGIGNCARKATRTTTARTPRKQRRNWEIEHSIRAREMGTARADERRTELREGEEGEAEGEEGEGEGEEAEGEGDDEATQTKQRKRSGRQTRRGERGTEEEERKKRKKGGHAEGFENDIKLSTELPLFCVLPFPLHTVSPTYYYSMAMRERSVQACQAYISTLAARSGFTGTTKAEHLRTRLDAAVADAGQSAPTARNSTHPSPPLTDNAGKQ